MKYCIVVLRWCWFLDDFDFVYLLCIQLDIKNDEECN